LIASTFKLYIPNNQEEDTYTEEERKKAIEELIGPQEYEDTSSPGTSEESDDDETNESNDTDVRRRIHEKMKRIDDFYTDHKEEQRKALEELKEINKTTEDDKYSNWTDLIYIGFASIVFVYIAFSLGSWYLA